MAKARAIVKRLKAVRNIRKITRTMELIATARFKKAMDRATEAAAYTRKVSELVADLSRSQLAQGAAKFTHPLLEAHPTEQNCILLVLTSNRGLCGAYNAGVLKNAQLRIRDAQAAQQNLSLEVSGKRGLNFIRFLGLRADQAYTHFEDKPAFQEVEVLANRYIDLYTQHKLDRLDVAYMRFDSSSRQTPVLETLLPIGQLTGAQAAAADAGAPVDYEFLPSAREILDEIVPAAFKARLFKCFLDAAVSEQIFRMVAMKGATENAGEMISDLSRLYNRARQAQITSELSEIIGGAAALE
jgi:F-type H+-transporting ATPase subunit gamma